MAYRSPLIGFPRSFPAYVRLQLAAAGCLPPSLASVALASAAPVCCFGLAFATSGCRPRVCLASVPVSVTCRLRTLPAFAVYCLCRPALLRRRRSPLASGASVACHSRLSLASGVSPARDLRCFSLGRLLMACIACLCDAGVRIHIACVSLASVLCVPRSVLTPGACHLRLSPASVRDPLLAPVAA